MLARNGGGTREGLLHRSIQVLGNPTLWRRTGLEWLTEESGAMASRNTCATPFDERVYAVVMAIPEGRVTTYGRIARALGDARSARMVGWALRRMPRGGLLPAHRVVNRIGFLSGGWHFGHPDIMRERLLAEDVPFIEEYQVDLHTALWDPADEPSLDHLSNPP